MKQVLILGGGVAGLACGLELAQNHYQVDIVEALPESGGLARNFHKNGFTFDIGPHRVYSDFPEVEKFMRELGGDESNLVHRQSRMRLKNRYFQYPLQASELLKGLPMSLWFKFMWGFVSKNMGKNNPDINSYAGYLQQKFGKGVCDFFFLPYARKVWGIDPQEISSDIVKVRISQKGLKDTLKNILIKNSQGPDKNYVSDFYYPRNGIGAIPAALAEKAQKAGVRIHLNSRVTEMVIDRTLYGTDVRQVICDTPNGTTTFTPDRIVSTIPLPELVKLLKPDDDEITQSARNLRHRNLILGCYMLRKPFISDDHWLYFPEESYHFTRLHLPANFSPAMCPPGKSSIVAEITCAGAEGRWKSTDLELNDLMSDDLLTTDLVQITDLEDYAIYRVPNAYPVYDLEYRNRLNRIFSWLRTINNLTTTGRQGLYHHNNLDHSILMGQAAAEFIQKPEPVQPWYDYINHFDRFRIVD